MNTLSKTIAIIALCGIDMLANTASAEPTPFRVYIGPAQITIGALALNGKEVQTRVTFLAKELVWQQMKKPVEIGNVTLAVCSPELDRGNLFLVVDKTLLSATRTYSASSPNKVVSIEISGKSGTFDDASDDGWTVIAELREILSSWMTRMGCK